MIIRAIESHFGCLFVAVAVAEAGVVVVAVVAVVVEEVAVEVDFNSETSDPLNLLSNWAWFSKHARETWFANAPMRRSHTSMPQFTWRTSHRLAK